METMTRSLLSVHLLFVCAGNVCRSPLAEGLATAWVARQVAQGSPDMRINSAGIEAAVGREMDPKSVRALSRLGGRPPARAAKALTPEMADEADLLLTMTRRHRRTVLEMSPRGLQRTFTLLEAADLLETADLTGLELVPVEERARELGRRLHAQRRFRNSHAPDDIEDPLGRAQGVHDRVGETIAGALRPLVAVLLRRQPSPNVSPGAVQALRRA